MKIELMLYLLIILLVKKLVCVASLIGIYASLHVRKEEASFVFTINVS